MQNDPISCLEQLGYTPREAAFLYLVARNSGYFLARQFNWFLRRKAGALTQGFVNKLRANEHVSVIDYGQRRFVFHLKSKTIYRLLGIENSQNRRVKGDHEIRLRLMVVDYMLDRLTDRFLSTEQEKVEFFCSLPDVSLTDLPCICFQSSTNSSDTTQRYFVERFPIAVCDSNQQKPLLVTVTYFDEGAFTTKAFRSFLQKHEPLLSKLKHFELAYIALNGQNFRSASKEFVRFYPPSDAGTDQGILPHGPDHLIHFFRAQRLWDANSSEFRHEDLLILRQGESLYVRPEHSRLRQAWVQGEELFERELQDFIEPRTTGGAFNTCLLDHSYPVFGYKNAGSW